MNQISLTQFTDFGSGVPWGLWVVAYVWLIGLSAGTFAALMWGHLRKNPAIMGLSRSGVLISLAALAAGLLSIILDLGRMERFYKLLLSPNPASVMAIMGWLYGFFGLVLLMMAMRPQVLRNRGVVGAAGALALVVLIAESLLFALPPGKAWHSLLFPVHFVTASLACGIAGLALAAVLAGRSGLKTEGVKGLAKVFVPLLALNIVVEILSAAVHGALLTPVIWIVIGGQLAALLLAFTGSTGGLFVGGVLVLPAVFMSKYHVLISAQLVEPFRNFSAAYVEPGLQFRYVPTGVEWLVTIGLVVIAMVIFVFLRLVIPKSREE